MEDPEVDVVYVGSIADQHAKMTKMCLEAGKPTVCEKPLTLNTKDTVELVQFARDNDVFLLEGMWTRFFPAMAKVNGIISSGEIGNVINVQGDFGWYNVDCPFPEDRIWNPSSGGMTYDIGMVSPKDIFSLISSNDYSLSDHSKYIAAVHGASWTSGVS